MKRLFKWLLPVLILAEAGLVWLDLLDIGEAILVVAAVEALLLLVGGYGLLAAVREYRRRRVSGLDGWRAIEDGLAVLLPKAAARLVVSEPRLFLCLVKWAFRKIRLREGEFSYHKRSTFDMLILTVVLVTPVEVLVIELLLQAFLPLLWLRSLLLILAVYAVFWMLGFHASRVTLPHRLEETRLRLHHGVFAEGSIPYSGIRNARLDRRKAPKWGDGLQISGDEAYLAIGGSADVTLELRPPRPLQGFFKPTKPVDTVHLAADEPERFLRELEKRVPETASAEEQTV